MSEIVLISGMIIVSAAMLAYSLWPKGDDEEEAVLRRMRGKTGSEEGGTTEKGASKPSAATDFVRKVAPIAVKPIMPKTDEELIEILLRDKDGEVLARWAGGRLNFAKRKG